MKRSRVVILVGTLVALSFLFVFAYRAFWSAQARVRAQTQRFWQAALAGDVETVRSMVAPDAAVPPEEWMKRAEGLQQPSTVVLRVFSDTPCGPIIVTVTSFSHWNPGTPLAVPTAWRIAPNGRWMVYTSEGYLCW